MKEPLDTSTTDDWLIKGEGNANIVFGYVGDSPSLQHRILRLRKASPLCTTDDVVQLERAVWWHIDSKCPEASERDDIYVDTYLSPLLGRQFIPFKEPVSVPPPLALALSLTANSPFTHIQHAVLMSDVTVFNAPSTTNNNALNHYSPLGSCLCVEIKPKCGFISKCPSIHPVNADVKHVSSRYQLHQQLKLEQGKTDTISKYDPLDLFSGEEERMKAALEALIECPQNNLLLFDDGTPVKVEEKEDVDSVLKRGFLESELTVEKRKELFVNMLYHVLQREGVLSSLLEAQQLCKYDIEGIYVLYCALLNLPPPTERSGGGLKYHMARNALRNLPHREAFEVLRTYGVSTTAKDCSIMITLQRINANNSNGNDSTDNINNAAVLEETRQTEVGGYGIIQIDEAWYRYRITFVDLDMKPLAKIPGHFELDDAIVKNARKQLMKTLH